MILLPVLSWMTSDRAFVTGARLGSARPSTGGLMVGTAVKAEVPWGVPSPVGRRGGDPDS